MRIWSLHPGLLDRAGLVACWRETLLAQKVLRGLTKGYVHHPQLTRFRALPDPVVAIATYLNGLAAEADVRGYSFDRSRIVATPDPRVRLNVTTGQLDYEWGWLQSKLATRSPALVGVGEPHPHPMFDLIDGPIEPWEIVRNSD